MKKPKKPFLLRINPKVLEAVEILAAQELRSTNAQIESILTEALKKRGFANLLTQSKASDQDES